MTQEKAYKLDSDRLAWYRDAKFGLFIHWGPYSAAGVEASWPIMAPVLSEVMFGTEISITEEEYTALSNQFNPQDFDPARRIQWDTGFRILFEA